MLDLIQLLPHCKKDVKLDTKTDRVVMNEVADMKVNGNSCCSSYYKSSFASYECMVPSGKSNFCGVQMTGTVCLLGRGAAAYSFLRLARRKTCTSGFRSHRMGRL